MGGEESWSLGGNQGKFALGLHDGIWCECQGSARTTHIFKNGVIGFKFQALNEYICMATSKRCGVATSDVEYRLFEDEPALIVTRYDRARRSNGNVVRLHQEDFCQALGIMPNQKYTSDGGPTTRDALALLCSTNRAHFNLLVFTQILFFNCLIGAPDAHAKNYSLLLGPDNDRIIAPMYDVASGLAYENLRRKGRLAMAVGGENRFGRVGSGAIHRYMGGNDPALAAMLEKAEFTEDSCTAIMADLAQEIPVSMAEVFDEAEAKGIPAPANCASACSAPCARTAPRRLRFYSGLPPLPGPVLTAEAARRHRRLAERHPESHRHPPAPVLLVVLGHLDLRQGVRDVPGALEHGDASGKQAPKDCEHDGRGQHVDHGSQRRDEIGRGVEGEVQQHGVPELARSPEDPAL